MSRGHRAARAILIGIVLLSAAAWTWVGLRQTLDAPLYMDDAFISFSYAQSFASGDGFVFNPEDGPVEGFTNFLWVVMTAAAMKLGFEPAGTMRAVGLLAWSGCVAAMALAILCRRSTPALAKLAGAALLGAMALPFGLVPIAGSGLETSFASLLAVLLGLFLVRDEPIRGGVHVALVAVQTAAFLTRLDSVVFLAAFSFVLLGVEWRRSGFVGGLRSTVKLQLPVVLLGVVFLAWKVAYFGDLLPNTYYAKSAGAASWNTGWTYWRAFLDNSPQTFVLAVLALLGALPGEGARVARYAVLGTTLYVIYAAKVGADFMYYRFAFEVYPLVVLGALVGVVRLTEPVRFRVARAGAALVAVPSALFLSTTEPVYEHEYGMQTLELMHAFVVEGSRVGRRLEEALPDDARIATTLAGVIPFYTDNYVLDQWGLSDREVAHQPDQKVRGRGHVKRAPVEYMLERKVHLVVDHPMICSCSRRCDEPQSNVYLRLEGDRCLRTWYLTQTPELTSFFCASPDFLTSGVDCSGRPFPTFSPSETELEAERLSRERLEALSPRAARLLAEPFDRLPVSADLFGTAFGRGGTRGSALPGQQPVRGRRGRYLNSFHGGDASTGIFVLPLPNGVRSVAFLVGGGGDCARTFVGLEHRGRILARACGREAETLELRAFELPAPTDELRFVAVDLSGEAWGHILVDEVLVFGEAPPSSPPIPVSTTARDAR